MIIFREEWVTRIAEFIGNSRLQPEHDGSSLPHSPGEREGLDSHASPPAPPSGQSKHPDLLYSRVQLPFGAREYSDFNIRARHLRCIETFFLEVDANDDILAVVSADGLRSATRTLNLRLIAALPTGEPQAARIGRLLREVLAEANRYTDVRLLRLAYIYCNSFHAPVGFQVSPRFIETPHEMGLFEQARIPHEGGEGRDAILLGIQAVEEGATA